VPRVQEAPREIATNRLTLRPPVSGDRALWVRLNRDPGLWSHTPHAMPASDEVAGGLFDDCLDRWGRTGFDLSVVEETSLRSGIGLGGVRRDEDHLALSFRLDRAAHGRGLAREAARAWTAHALEWLPTDPLVAHVADADRAAVRTVLSVGMERADQVPDVDGDGPRTRFEAPRVESPEWFDERTREHVLDLWCAVNDDDGAVGFLPGAERGRVAEALAAHEEEMADGLTTAVLLRAPDETVVGVGFWVADRNRMRAHERTAFRIMTDPARRGRNLGRLLMAAMHRVARDAGVELATLVVRSGTGASRFYERAGYVEVGRVPGNIRVAPGDDRDSVVMARRLDGRPLVADGRP
jgi:RimJ/RimL family protein N-acetyltransferase